MNGVASTRYRQNGGMLYVPSDTRHVYEYDPYWAQVGFLLSGDGANGSTTILDATGKTWTPNNANVTVDTTLPLFPVDDPMRPSLGAVKFASGYITTPSHSSLTIGTNNYTFEAFVRANAGGTALLFDNRTGGSGIAIYYTESTFGLRVYSSTTALLTLTVDQTPRGVWGHVAVSRIGTSIYAHIDGVLGGSGTDSSTHLAGVNQIGGNASAQNFNGRMDEIRLTNGTARYGNANFIPPSRPFPRR